MFEPLQELLHTSGEGERVILTAHAAFGHAVIEDTRVLGEKDGRLFGSSEETEYVDRGGAVYATHRFANNAVAGRETSYRDKPLPAGWPSARRQRRQSTGVVRGALNGAAALARAAVCCAAFWFPTLRVLFPSAVPRPDHRLAVAARSSAELECVAAVAFHPQQMVAAVAVDEGGADGGARVTVYDVADARVVSVLSHAFQRNVQSVAWKPQSEAVLAVGCRGGVLLWTLSGTAPAGSRWASAESLSPLALFYRCSSGMPVSTMDFACGDGRFLACGSRWTARLHVLDIGCGPQAEGHVLYNGVPAVEGACERVLFSDDATFVLSAVSAAPCLCVVQLGEFPCTSTTVDTPAPIVQMEKASGVGPNYFFLSTKALHGVLLAHINGFVGVSVVTMISTGLCRGVGGAVRRVAASKRRLWVATETGHVLTCHYGCNEGRATLIPIGIAAMDVTLLSQFPGCTTGSLVAVAEADGTVAFVPSYHV